MHFFEAIQRDIDFTLEYLKIEKVIINEERKTDYAHYQSINKWIELNFRDWDKRDTYLSFNELRGQLGFITVSNSGRINEHSIPESISMEEYFLYCEIIVNLAYDLAGINSPYLCDIFDVIIETMRLNIERSGFEFKRIIEGIIVTEKNASAIEAAEIMPNIKDIIVEYNHYLLKGNLNRKKELLRNMASALEPERLSLESACQQEAKDFFFMVNKMNIRHNNCDPSDRKNYCKEFAALTDTEKEAWYDKIYEQALAILIIRKQRARTKEIANFKAAINS